MTEQEFEAVYYPKYVRDIRHIAMKYSQKDPDLFEDLFQEGLLALYRCNLATVRTNESAFVRQAVKFRIVDFLRKAKLTHSDSLEMHLENGRQLAKDADRNMVLTPHRKPGTRPTDRRYFEDAN